MGPLPGRSLRPLRGGWLFVPFAAALSVGACAFTPQGEGVVAVSPPPAPRGFFGGLEWPRVASLRPTLKWKPFVPAGASGGGAAGAPADVVVTYDVKIASALGGEPYPVVYERQGLTGTSHTVEEPLEPGSIYFWSVRARMQVGGETRFTPWGKLPDSGAPGSWLSYRFVTPLR